MIGKILPHKQDFGSLAGYLLYGRDRQSPQRVDWVAMRNLEGASPETAHLIMSATAKQSKRVKKPRQHLIVSWANSDLVSQDQMLNVMDQTLADLGLSAHQAMYVAHNDTEHCHVHAIINRVHPETFKASKDAHERLKLRKSLMRQERDLGLERTPFLSLGAHDRKTFSEIEIAKRTGSDLLLRFSKERCLKLRNSLAGDFKSARSWRHLSDMMKRRGYKLALSGAGVRIERGFHYAKLSDVTPPNIRVKHLTQRWGKFSDYWNKEQKLDERRLSRKRKRNQKSRYRTI